MSDKIDDLQLSLISKSKSFLHKCNKKNIDISLSPFCDLTSWNDGLGFQRLLLLKNNKKFSLKLLIFYFYELFGIGRFKFSYFKSPINNLKSKKKINILYSYCWADSFDKNNIFYDPYFRLNSKKDNFYFFLISMDGYIPRNFKNSTIIFKRKIFFNITIFINEFIKKIFKGNFFHKFNSTNIFSEFVGNTFYENFKKKRLKLFIPYENRPHQNSIIKSVKEISKKNKVFCYLHNMPWPFQIDMHYKTKNIDKLLVSSKIQKKIFVKNYSWPIKIVKAIPSIRFKKLYKRNKTIFLPYDLTENRKTLLKSFILLINKVNFDLKNYKISIHPHKVNSLSHVKFKNDLLIIIKNFKKKSKSKKIDTPIIFAHPGGTATECLQTSNSVYHISCDKLSIFSEKIWKKVKVIEISKNIYKYSSYNINFINLKKNHNKVLNLIN